jgi:hypothetical protein
MLKKVLILASVVALVLASAQLALAQQDSQPGQVQATHNDVSGMQGTGGSQTAGDTQAPPEGASQAAALDPSPQNMIPGTAPAGPDHGALMHLNNNNELVVDCTAVDGALSRRQQSAPTSTDSQSQAELTGLQELSQLCAESGFSTSTSPTAQPQQQPQQSGSTTSPTGTSSTQPQQNIGGIPSSG